VRHKAALRTVKQDQSTFDERNMRAGLSGGSAYRAIIPLLQ